ncbi:MAG: PIN domain protein [Promethearchaeota archaeon]|nr:MAG: PIN domain protein [Candidatus Lokiarchaeota archaeon]
MGFSIHYISFKINEVITLPAIRSKNVIRILNHLQKLLWEHKKIAIFFPFKKENKHEIWQLFKKVKIIDLKDKKSINFIEISSIIFCKHHQIQYIVSHNAPLMSFLKK